MRLLVVDDEAPARVRLVRMLETLAGVDVCGEAASGPEALALAARIKPDVVLLDVRMPGMDGLETARHLGMLEPPPAILFTTAYDEYALKAFETGAIGYLLKPVRDEKLEAALERAAKPTQAQLATLGPPRARTHIAAQMHGALRVVQVEKIACFVAGQKYVSALHAGGELLIEDSLKSLASEFGDRFLRVHRNALVSPAHVERLETDDGSARLVLRGGIGPLAVSRRHLSEVRRALKGTT